MTEARAFGGNLVRLIDAASHGRHVFADRAYSYFLHVGNGRESVTFPELQSYSVFVLSKPEGAAVSVDDGRELKQGDVCQVESVAASVAIEGAGVRLLVAGTKDASGVQKGVSVTAAAAIYRVVKPWGHELWINGQHPGYALKEIAIKAGTKTSLQYHRRKQETNVLFRGRARLHYKQHDEVSNEDVTAAGIGSVDLSAVSTIDVSPPTLHRLEAITDLLLYEVSTPHLDDVVRIQDDANRPDGLIASEHMR